MRLYRVGVACGLAALMAAVGGTRAQEPAAVALDADDIGGVVTSAQGPEAGVWVIAETRDLPTPFARIVVTDDGGRYVVPDLPEADYEVFVRGYGLLDSERVAGVRGQRLDLAATVAPDGRSAAAVYPPGSWLSLLEIPDGDIPPLQVASTVKSCLQCHPLGNEGTRRIPAHLEDLPTDEAWLQRLNSELFGGSMMTGMFRGLGEQAGMFGRWTDAIAAGAYPEPPPRPSGLERKVVITVWDWATPQGSRSDSQGTYAWNQTLNAGGRVYGVHQEDTMLSWLDPATHEVGRIELDAQGLRSIAMDGEGRVWATARLDPGDAPPDFCGPGSENPYLANFRPGGSPKQAVVYDPRDGSVEKIPSCLAVDHNHFTDEDDRPIYFGVNDAVGWISTEVWDETQDAEASQGWCPAVLDTNGDGVITEWTEPDEPISPGLDRRIEFGCYSIGVDTNDGSLWCAGIGEDDNKLVRFVRGDDPPESCMAEVFEAPELDVPIFKSGGVAVDGDGIVWLNWRGSDQVTSFDRSRCDVTSGPTATGRHCPEGWAVHQMDRPNLRGTPSPLHAEMMYLTQIDHADVLGLGGESVITGPVNSYSLQVLIPATGEFLDMVVPYPKGFFSRSAQGRIDDPDAGWKGRGLWSNYSTYTPHFIEGGTGPKIVKFQMRPSPLDR